MFDFGRSLISMTPDEQKVMLDNANPGQRKTALEMGIGFNNQNRQQQQRQQKRDAYHDLDRFNFTVEKENEAHDFFGKGLADWQKNVTGNEPSRDATNLKKQFDDYEQSVLSTVPKGGRRHEALSKSLPGIKKGFLQQGHQFAMDKLNERSRSVLDKGLQRIAKGALGAKDENSVQAHDDAAFDLINKYVLSEAEFHEKDADVMYDKYLRYAGVQSDKPKAIKVDAGKEAIDEKLDEAIAFGADASLGLETISNRLVNGKEEKAVSLKEKFSVAHARDLEKIAEIRDKYPAPNDNYPFDENTYEFLSKNKEAINSAAGKFGVSSEAIGGAMGDEFNRSGFGDKLQDQYILLDADLAEVEENIFDGHTKGKWNKTMLRPAAHDIGPGNMNVATLHGMFVDRFENGESNDKLKQELAGVIDPKAPREDQWKQYVEFATTPEGTAILAAAHMEDAAKKLKQHMEGLSQEEKDAVLVTYYKQGPGYLEKYKKSTAKKAGADSAESNRAINPGEGVGLLYQINKIRSVLGK